MRSWVFGVVAFGGTGLVGPIVRSLTWPPVALDDSAVGRISYSLYMFTKFLMPASDLSVYAKTAAESVAIVFGANFAAFAVVGLLVGTAGRRPVALVFTELSAVGMLLIVPLSRYAAVAWDLEMCVALLAAVTVYVFPCWMVWRRVRPQNRGDATRP
jgi:hypothetical protein